MNLETCKGCENFYSPASAFGYTCLLKLEKLDFELPGIVWKKGKNNKMQWVKTTEEEYRAHEEKTAAELLIQHPKFEIPENCPHAKKHKKK